MMTSIRKEHPLSMRLPESDVAIIDRAAGLRGRSRTDFVRDAAVRAAEDDLLRSAMVRMTGEEFDAFTSVLSAPPELVPQIMQLLRRKSPWEGVSAEVSREAKHVEAREIGRNPHEHDTEKLHQALNWLKPGHLNKIDRVFRRQIRAQLMARGEQVGKGRGTLG